MLNVFLLVTGLTVAGGDAPKDEAVLGALPPLAAGIPGVFEVSQDSIIIVKNRITRRSVAMPLYGGATVNVGKETWECVVYANDVIEASFPVTFSMRPIRPRVTVVHLDVANPLRIEQIRTRY
jgi:hypothetical protein